MFVVHQPMKACFVEAESPTTLNHPLNNGWTKRRGLEPVPFASAHCTGSKLLFVEHLYPLKRFRLNG
jgi:hypothetical protein